MLISISILMFLGRVGLSQPTSDLIAKGSRYAATASSTSAHVSGGSVLATSNKATAAADVIVPSGLQKGPLIRSVSLDLDG